MGDSLGAGGWEVGYEIGGVVDEVTTRTTVARPEQQRSSTCAELSIHLAYLAVARGKHVPNWERRKDMLTW